MAGAVQDEHCDVAAADEHDSYSLTGFQAWQSNAQGASTSWMLLGAAGLLKSLSQGWGM